MKLKTYDQSNAKRAHHSSPAISFGGKAGLIRVTDAGVTILKVENTTTQGLLFHQDEENPKDWYVEVTSRDKGGLNFQRKESKGGRGLYLNSTSLARLVLASLGKTQGETVSIPLATEPTKLSEDRLIYALLTKAVTTNS